MLSADEPTRVEALFGEKTARRRSPPHQPRPKLASSPTKGHLPIFSWIATTGIAGAQALGRDPQITNKKPTGDGDA